MRKAPPARRQTPRRLRSFCRDERGFFTAFSVCTLVVMVLFAGFALDLASHYSARTQLQVAADTAAHAALVRRQRQDAQDAKASVLSLHARNMPLNRFGAVLTENDIEFGTWNFSTGQFTPNPNARGAARATARLERNRGNELRTFLLRFAGVPHFDVEATAVYSLHLPPCLDEGLVAEGRVDLQSNNAFGAGFCVHSNDYVRLNNHNTFAPGTVVSMPDLDDLWLPGSGFDHNDGLEEALREGQMDVRILRELQDLIEGFRTGLSDQMPEFITNLTPVIHSVSGNNVTLSNTVFETGRIHEIRCDRDNATLTITGSQPLSDVVIVTDCRLDFGSSSRVHDVIIATTNASDKSISGSANADIGADDNCAPGGGARILTLGGMRFASGVGIFGSQLVAAGDVNFAAQARGVYGAAIVAGGKIDGTSNAGFGTCGGNNEERIQVPYFRMVM